MEKELRELHEKMDYIIDLLRKGRTFMQKEIKVVSQLDPKLFEDYLKTSDDEKTIINSTTKSIKNNKGLI